jgi:hypothetical protein
LTQKLTVVFDALVDDDEEGELPLGCASKELLCPVAMDEDDAPVLVDDDEEEERPLLEIVIALVLLLSQ